MTSYETSVLSKGLSFIPVTKADSFTTRVELFKFLRPIKLKAFFAKADDSASPQQTISDASASTSPRDVVKTFKPKSRYIPPALNPSVSTFCILVEQDVTNCVSVNKKRKLYSNIFLFQKHPVRALFHTLPKIRPSWQVYNHLLNRYLNTLTFTLRVWFPNSPPF